MKISFKGDYALKVILDLAINFGNEKVQIKDISKRQDIPFKFLQQLVLHLRSAGYVKTKTGPQGGICLAKSPKEITVGEIIRLIEGTTSPIACVNELTDTKCADKSWCVFRCIWIEIRDKINEIVDNITFEDLAKRAKELRKNCYYVI
ncbi:MAG: Rrf2 family transcriptional regulator [Endomicrobiia bacterium]